MDDQLYSQLSDETSVIIYTLFKLTIFALILERALYFIFDFLLVRKFSDKYKEGSSTTKYIVTFILALYCSYYYDIDVVAITLDQSAGSSAFGILLTALVVAGGSSGMKTLIQDILGLGRAARKTSKNNDK